MNRNWAGRTYTTELHQNNAEGWIAVHLLRDGQFVARVVYWDAVGQYFVDPTLEELPVEILERLIVEARETIRVP